MHSIIDLQDSSAYEVYNSREMSELIKASWIHTLQHTPVSPILETMLREPLHEQVIAFPTLGYWPEIEELRSFNEKIMHQKLYYNNDLYTKVSDKWQVREYVRKRVGPEILTDVYQVTDNPDSIRFGELPDQFVVKGTHGSSMETIVQDKQSEDFQSIISDANNWLAREYGRNTKEY